MFWNMFSHCPLGKKQALIASSSPVDVGAVLVVKEGEIFVVVLVVDGRSGNTVENTVEKTVV